MAKVYLEHELKLKDRFKEETGLDLKETIEKLDPIRLSALDDKVGCKFNGYENLHDYHYNAACCWSIPKIKVPTLFMNSLDDPLIDDSIIDFESIRDNENCILATNDCGGHIGYVESLIEHKIWVRKPVLDFLHLLSI